MKRLLLLVLLMLSAMSLRGWADSPAETLTIYTKFAHLPSARAIESMKAELVVIMLPFDLLYDWRSLDRANGHDVVAQVLVVSFVGACRADLLPPTGLSGSTLGEIHIVDGEILPFADVDCDKIRELINAPLAIAADRDALLGRAMARVLAHEMYHLLVHTTVHASSGIAKAFFSKADLACNRLKFDERQLRLMRDVGSLSALGASPGL